MSRGTCAAPFERVRAVFERNFEELGEVGCSVCVIFKGTVVVDLWGGLMVKASKRDKRFPDDRPWERDTLVNVFSCTKAMANLCIALLVQWKLLSYDDAVSRHWGGFAAGGKGEITVAQLLSHQSGLSALDGDPLTLDELREWNAAMDQYYTSGVRGSDCVLRRLENQKPFRAPPRASTGESAPFVAYHPITVGLYVAELVQRVDPRHRTLPRLFSEEIAAPLRADVFIGLSKGFDTRRIAKLYAANPIVKIGAPPLALEMPEAAAGLDIGSLTQRAFGTIAKFSVWRQRHLNVPSAIGFATARGLASVYADVCAAFSRDGGRQARVFQRDPLQQAVEPAVEECFDITLMCPRTYTKGGFVRDRALFSQTSFHHSGSGGSIGYADTEHDIAFAYVPNGLIHDDAAQMRERYVRLIRAVYECIGESRTSRARL